MELGEKIRLFRRELRLTQKQVAEMTGLSNSYLSDIELGRTDPSLKTLRKLGKVFKRDLVEFFI